MTTCNFSCDPGYSFVGSMERTCQANNSWSGSNTSCDIMLCEVLQSPSNGFVVLPCNREFQSVCSVTCEGGYYTEGPYTQRCEVSENGIVEWSTAPMCRGMQLYNKKLFLCGFVKISLFDTAVRNISRVCTKPDLLYSPSYA